MLIHVFLHDPGFVEPGSVLDPVRRNGGLCTPSQQALSYFVNPQEFTDERAARASNLNMVMSSKPRLLIDQAEYAGLLTDIQTVWSPTERQNLFAILDQLCFAYNVNATNAQVEAALVVWSQYLTNSHVYSTTTSTAMAYNTVATAMLTCPDFVTFTFVIANGTQYQLRVWLNNALFLQNYPLSTIGLVVPSLPLATLYTLSIVSSTANVFATALLSSSTSQQTLQSALQTGQYSGYVAQPVSFVDSSGDSTVVQFNLLYNGCAPGPAAARTAIRAALFNSGVGTTAGWQALAPSLFITELWYLLPLWENSTSLVNSVIYPNIVSAQQALTDATTILYDIPSGFVLSNAALLSAPYNNLTLIAVPDTENLNTRLSLAAEHPTYQNVPTTAISFETMAPLTQQFATLLGYALAAASGLATTNAALLTETAPSDNRTYVTFTVGDVAYNVITKATYLTLVHTP